MASTIAQRTVLARPARATRLPFAGRAVRTLAARRAALTAHNPRQVAVPLIGPALLALGARARFDVQLSWPLLDSFPRRGLMWIRGGRLHVSGRFGEALSGQPQVHVVQAWLSAGDAAR